MIPVYPGAPWLLKLLLCRPLFVWCACVCVCVCVCVGVSACSYTVLILTLNFWVHCLERVEVSTEFFSVLTFSLCFACLTRYFLLSFLTFFEVLHSLLF